ncbi:hypothetical protein CASFOL_008021 [Castilleja foliolosa]|uniref:Uncharacterized protein n=1 Tax=Castilleja foliolosa TaxID=1961234 RepID=A0ABD3DXS8_9LAMI
MDDNGSNNIHGEEKPEEEEGWIGGMFDFSEAPLKQACCCCWQSLNKVKSLPNGYSRWW